MVYNLEVGDKLYCSDKGFGEKHGVVLKVNPTFGEARIKWEEHEQSMLYSSLDLRNLFEQDDPCKVTKP